MYSKAVSRTTKARWLQGISSGARAAIATWRARRRRWCCHFSCVRTSSWKASTPVPKPKTQNPNPKPKNPKPKNQKPKKKMEKQKYSTLEGIKKGFIDCLKITLVFTLVFSLLQGNFSPQKSTTTFLVSALYSYGIGFGNGLINDILDRRWNWLEQTNLRVYFGIFCTILYTIPVVLGIDYLTFVVFCAWKYPSFSTTEWFGCICFISFFPWEFLFLCTRVVLCSIGNALLKKKSSNKRLLLEQMLRPNSKLLKIKSIHIFFSIVWMYWVHLSKKIQIMSNDSPLHYLKFYRYVLEQKV